MVKYTFVTEWSEEGYVSRCLQHPDRMARGDTPDAALKALTEQLKALPPPTSEIIPIYHTGDVWGVTRQDYTEYLGAMLKPDGYSGRWGTYPFLSGVRSADTPRLTEAQIRDLLTMERFCK